MAVDVGLLIMASMVLKLPEAFQVGWTCHSVPGGDLKSVIQDGNLIIRCLVTYRRNPIKESDSWLEIRVEVESWKFPFRVYCRPNEAISFRK